MTSIAVIHGADLRPETGGSDGMGDVTTEDETSGATVQIIGRMKCTTVSVIFFMTVTVMDHTGTVLLTCPTTTQIMNA